MENKPNFINPNDIEAQTGSIYPEVFKSYSAGRKRRRLSDALGLKNFGVNHVTIPPGGKGALRHWHKVQDEFLYILKGALTLKTNAGEQILTAGMAAGFRAGEPNGHGVFNHTQEDVVFLEVGDRTLPEEYNYPDVDLKGFAGPNGPQFTHKDGNPY